MSESVIWDENKAIDTGAQCPVDSYERITLTCTTQPGFRIKDFEGGIYLGGYSLVLSDNHNGIILRGFVRYSAHLTLVHCTVQGGEAFLARTWLSKVTGYECWPCWVFRPFLRLRLRLVGLYGALGITPREEVRVQLLLRDSRERLSIHTYLCSRQRRRSRPGVVFLFFCRSSLSLIRVVTRWGHLLVPSGFPAPIDLYYITPALTETAPQDFSAVLFCISYLRVASHCQDFPSSLGASDGHAFAFLCLSYGEA